MGDLSDDRVRQVYMDHCARLMSMQKLFRHNPDAREVEQLVLTACFELQKMLEPHMRPEEKQTLSDRITYALRKLWKTGQRLSSLLVATAISRPQSAKRRGFPDAS